MGAEIQNHTAVNGSMEDGESLTFCHVHGSWHSDWCFNESIAKLKSDGHEAFAVELPIESPDADMRLYAERIASEIADKHDEKNTWLVAHSRMAAVVPLVTGHLSLRGATLVCPGFDSNYNPFFMMRNRSPVPEKYGKGFAEGIKDWDEDPKLKIYDKEMAKHFFYHDCAPEVQEQAVRHMRPMNRAKRERLISKWPEKLKPSMIYTTGDRVINPRYSGYVAKALGLRAFVMAGGHCPFLSQPREFTRLLEQSSLSKNNR